MKGGKKKKRKAALSRGRCVRIGTAGKHRISGGKVDMVPPGKLVRRISIKSVPTDCSHIRASLLSPSKQENLQINRP